MEKQGKRVVGGAGRIDSSVAGFCLVGVLRGFEREKKTGQAKGGRKPAVRLVGVAAEYSYPSSKSRASGVPKLRAKLTSKGDLQKKKRVMWSLAERFSCCCRRRRRCGRAAQKSSNKAAGLVSW
jgi:hypothetical protein